MQAAMLARARPSFVAAAKAQRTKGIRARRSVRVCAKVRLLERRRGAEGGGGTNSLPISVHRRPGAPAARLAAAAGQTWRMRVALGGQRGTPAGAALG